MNTPWHATDADIDALFDLLDNSEGELFSHRKTDTDSELTQTETQNG
jgi:hypothetical protein